MHNPLLKINRFMEQTGAKFGKTSLAKPFQNIENKFCNPKALPTFRTVTTAICFAYLAFGEMVNIARNKNMPEEKKQYLIPQTATEGTIYAVSMLGLGTLLKNGAQKIFERGVLPFNSIKSALAKNKGKIGEILKSKEFTPAIGKMVSKAEFETMHNLNNGVKTFGASLIAIPVTMNIIGPVITNAVAKAHMKKIKKSGQSEIDPKLIQSNQFMPATSLKTHLSSCGNKSPFNTSPKVSQLYNNFNNVIRPQSGLKI